MSKAKKALIDVTNGSQGLSEDETYAAVIRGEMTYFPLCCSTGILQNFTTEAYKPKQHSGYIDSPTPLTSTKRTKVEKALYLDDIIEAIGSNQSFISPLYFARWYAMAKIWRKHAFGHDKHGPGAYSGFKCAQVTMFDRLLEDKDPSKGFRFTYNQTYAICHLMEWLREHGNEYGEVYISPAVPGAHGARVYGCIFTGDVDALKKYHDERIEVVREHYLALDDYYNSVVVEKPKQATNLDAMPSFVAY